MEPPSSVDLRMESVFPQRSSMPLWFRLLPVSTKEELHKWMVAIVAKQQTRSDIEEDVALIQRRFLLQEVQITEMINYYRMYSSATCFDLLGVSPSENEVTQEIGQTAPQQNGISGC